MACCVLVPARNESSLVELDDDHSRNAASIALERQFQNLHVRCQAFGGVDVEDDLELH